MIDFATEYSKATELAEKYSTATGRAIEVSSSEAVELARKLATTLYQNECFLREILNLRGYMEQLAAGEHDSEECPECQAVFRTGWMDGKCPYCAAGAAAQRYVEDKMAEVDLP